MVTCRSRPQPKAAGLGLGRARWWREDGQGPGSHAERRPLSRHSTTVAQLEEKLAGARRQLGQLRAQEAGLQREQGKADTHRKMTEF